MNYINQIIQGDALEVLKQMPDKFVQMCVTSPPYYGLRDYGTANWIGGNEKCDHIDIEKLNERKRQQKSMIKVGERIDGSTRIRIHDEMIGVQCQHKYKCLKCGAIRQDQQIGLEETPDCKLRGFMKLRADLTPNQQAFVAQRLKDEGYFYV
jgi:site-specific DNA-methyltransferase (cytosine-N4-specific)